MDGNEDSVIESFLLKNCIWTVPSTGVTIIDTAMWKMGLSSKSNSKRNKVGNGEVLVDVTFGTLQGEEENLNSKGVGEGARQEGSGQGVHLGEGEAIVHGVSLADNFLTVEALAVRRGNDDISKAKYVDENREDKMEDVDHKDEDSSDRAMAVEEDSWVRALQATASLADSTVKPAVDSARLPKRLQGNYAIIFINGEWQLAKIEGPVKDREQWYRYKLTASWEYGTIHFSSESHGRRSESSQRWVLCV